MDKQKYDLIIIGGGPIGLCCAIEASKAGLHYLVLEKGVLVNSLYRFPTNMTFFSTSKLLEIGDIPFISHSEKPTRRESLEYFRRVKESWDLQIRLFEEVQEMEPVEDQSYRIQTNNRTYYSQSVVIATGFYDTPRKLNIPGEELPKVKHFYDEAHPYIGQELLVVGAANSACDVALETYHKGAKVTMAIRQDKISPRVKYWIRPNIENRIKEGSIKAHFNTTITAIHPDRVDLLTPQGPQTIANDFVLAMTGYQPNFQLLRQLGIQLADDGHLTPIHNPETLETNLPNVYIAGVVNAGLQTSKLFIENSRVHAEMILKAIGAKASVP
ncbi:MAG: YpdA family putative bacillithiol disulfide reductase [Bacteroidota bacterium]